MNKIVTKTTMSFLGLSLAACAGETGTDNDEVKVRLAGDDSDSEQANDTQNDAKTSEGASTVKPKCGSVAMRSLQVSAFCCW